MERIATIVLLVASVAALGYLKMEQLDLYATIPEIAAAAAVESAAADAAELVEAAKIRFTIPHDRDVNTTDITVALDGSESFDAEGDSLSYSWTQTSCDTAKSGCRRCRWEYDKFPCQSRRIHI